MRKPSMDDPAAYAVHYRWPGVVAEPADGLREAVKSFSGNAHTVG
ncbi:hypothetical protein Val02_42910 [Virgisporangium aliadipatigenens]|uniref:Uncharacterized protein n=1 Tax=Virgisporangium aliadipatigenens TaxID=741659 RepID=A0A8J3YP17_9ACTN|nr:hypothetical protein [Virgisporangium aliadipatigenens]GIJ47405.1 hypothetical protein Val02_42910 [Virgisporangium aliadipatigenens]